jgi:hypothetical protein
MELAKAFEVGVGAGEGNGKLVSAIGSTHRSRDGRGLGDDIERRRLTMQHQRVESKALIEGRLIVRF